MILIPKFARTQLTPGKRNAFGRARTGLQPQEWGSNILSHSDISEEDHTQLNVQALCLQSWARDPFPFAPPAEAYEPALGLSALHSQAASAP